MAEGKELSREPAQSGSPAAITALAWKQVGFATAVTRFFLRTLPQGFRATFCIASKGLIGPITTSHVQ